MLVLTPACRRMDGLRGPAGPAAGGSSTSTQTLTPPTKPLTKYFKLAVKILRRNCLGEEKNFQEARDNTKKCSLRMAEW